MVLLKTPEAAAKLRLSPKTLELWRSSGEGPAFVRIGRRRVAYTRKDLEDWLLRQRHDPRRRCSIERTVGPVEADRD